MIKNYLNKKIILKFLGWIIIAIALYYFSRNIIVNWNQVKNFSWKPNFFYLFLASIIELFIQFIGVYIWKKLLEKLENNISYLAALKIWFISSLGRYLPGKAWQMAGMSWLLTKKGIKIETSITVSVLIQILSIIPGIIIGFYTLFFAYPNFKIPFFVLISFITIFVITMIFYKNLFLNILKFLSRNKISSFSLSYLTSTDIFMFFLIYLFFWLIRGLGFFFFIKTWYPLPYCFILSAISIFSASYIGGLLFIFVPGGFGIREGIMQNLMVRNVLILSPIATTISILSRIWISIIEVICLLFSLIINWRRNG